MIEPIRPDQVVELKSQIFPEEVITAFNTLIAEHYLNGRASFTIQEAEAALRVHLCSNHITHKWYDVEDLYRAAGWEVTYDKPAFNESGSATYTFRKPS